MINSSLKGITTLFMAIVLLALSSLLLFFSANSSRLQTSMMANQARRMQAIAAAEAGLEFAINYLKQNRSAILANPSNGYLRPYANSSTNNVVLPNNSRYTITYNNPVAYNYNLILITATGTSSDNSLTRTISQKVEWNTLLAAPPANTLTSRGAITLKQNARASNPSGSISLQSAATVTLMNNAFASSATGSSSPGSIGRDIQQNVSSLANMTESNFTASFFDINTSSLQSQMAYTFTNSGTTNYSSQLDGLSGTTIWINQTSGMAKIKGNVTIGSANNPVLLIVNGKLQMSGNATIYGFVIVMGDDSEINDNDGEGTLSGNATIIGAVASSSNIKLSKNGFIVYNQNVITNLTNQNPLMYYAKVAGSWKDF